MCVCMLNFYSGRGIHTFLLYFLVTAQFGQFPFFVSGRLFNKNQNTPQCILKSVTSTRDTFVCAHDNNAIKCAYGKMWMGRQRQKRHPLCREESEPRRLRFKMPYCSTYLTENLWFLIKSQIEPQTQQAASELRWWAFVKTNELLIHWGKKF